MGVLHMKKPLLDVTFTSEKRKEVLLLLQDGPKEMKDILQSLNTSRQALLPQMKILKEHHLVNQVNDSYELTNIGKLVVNKMVPLVSIVEVFETDIDYWGSRELDFIPSHLLSRLSDIKNCITVRTHYTDMHTIQMSYHEASKKSKSLAGITAFYHPSFPKVFSELMHLNVKIYVVITNEVLDRLRTHREPEFEKLLGNNLFHLYVYPRKLGFLSMGFNDYQLLLRIFRKSGEFDNDYITCSHPESLKWGKELFEYYLKDSTPMSEI
jgi:predicted transcriptional regulator